MTCTTQHKATIFYRALKVLAAVGFCLFVLTPVVGQNTKGDKPSPGRESRFKSPFRKSAQKRKGPSSSNKRVKPKTKSKASSVGIFTRRRAKGGDKAGQPIRPIYSGRPSNRQRAWTGDVAGRRIRTRESTGSSRNVYPQTGPMVHNPSRKPRSGQRPVSNRSTLARLKKLQGPEPGKPGKKRVVIPRSASGSFVARRTNNNWKRFPQQRKKGEVAYTRDIAGRRLRTLNYETKRPGYIAPTFKPYYGRKRVGDRPYRGPTRGGYVSATRTGRAWRGDISGNAIRGRNFFSKGKRTEGQPYWAPRNKRPKNGDRVYRGTIPGGGYRSATRSGETRPGKSPLAVRSPGIGARGIGNFSGNIKRGRPAKGGGSVSGRTWNNNQSPISVRAPGIGANRIGKFQGNIKGGRPLKGGGSVSGKLWNNRQTPIAVRTPSGTAMRAGRFAGNMKGSRKPLKGGGSISGKLWNNNQTPIPVRTPPQSAQREGRYPGNIKKFSIQPGFRDQGEEFTGVIKAKRPKKGGGSISGKLWNNKETPIPVKTPPESARKEGKYPGNIKRFSVQPGFSDQGEEFTGYIKLKKFKKNYVKNPNAAELALKKKRPDKSTYQVGDLQVKVKRRNYVENPNSSEDALLKLKPGKNTYQVGELQVKVKEKAYGKKPHAAEGSMPGIKPTRDAVRASVYARGVKQTWKYIRNPSSADEALKVREPGKAFARSTDYQGNIRMKKFDLFGKRGLHPDAQFVKTNKNNVAEERDMLTNFKLWWARLFKKNETQPDHLKDKGHKPRYDKGEQGLWYE